MRQTIRAAAFLAAVMLPTLGVACPLATVDAQGARFAARVTTEPAPIPLNAPFSLILDVCPIHDDTPAEAIALDAAMPSHGHGMNYRPTVTRLDDRRWRAEGFLFHMPGSWRITIVIESEGTVDRLTLDRAVP